MKKILTIACLSLSAIYLQAQTLYTSGSATIYVSGAGNINGSLSATPTLYVSGAVNNTGTIQNAGEMQITGNFANPGTFSSTGDDGFVGSAAQALSGGFSGAEGFANLIVDKTANPLTLSVNADVATSVNLVNGKISIGNNSLILAPSASITGYDANDYIQTGGTGTLRQTVGASNIVFPVGISSYNPLTMDNTGTSDVFSIRVQDVVICQGNNPLSTTAKVNRRWNMTEGTLGGSNATITVQWNMAEEDATFNRAQSSVATYDSSIPTYNLSATNTNATTVSPGIFSQTHSGQTLIGHQIVTSIAPITAGGATSFCDGGSVLLTSPTDALFTYQWMKDGTNIGGATASTYSADMTGAYTPRITVNGTCTITPAAIAVTELPVPPAPVIAFSTPSVPDVNITVCTTSPVTMYSSTANVYEYVWYKNSIVNNYLLTPNNSYSINTSVAGTDVYTLAVTYTGSTCLSALSNTLTVVKTAPPAIITPAGPTTFCANVPTTLNANIGANLSYTWKRSTTVVQTGASSSYIPTASGNHNVTVTDGTTSCSSTSPWLSITIKALPVANAGVDKNVCDNGAVQIGSASIAPNTYAWSPSTGLSNPSIANPMASPLANTTYTVTVNNPSTTCSNTDAMQVSVIASPPTPTLSNTPSPVCQGNTISITPTIVGATSVDWYKNGAFLYTKPTSFVQNVTAYSVAADDYTIKNKAANGCFSALSNIASVWVKEAAQPTITSSPAAVGSNVTICNPGGSSGTATLTANSTTASPTYSWKLAGNYISAANTNTYLATVTTTNNNKLFSVEATYPNGCIRTSANINVKVQTSGCTPKLGSDKDDADMLIGNAFNMSSYPNPTTGKLNVEISNSDATMGKLVLYNTLGQVVISNSIMLVSGKGNEELDLSQLAKGVYTLSFQTDKIQHIEKIIKE